MRGPLGGSRLSLRPSLSLSSPKQESKSKNCKNKYSYTDGYSGFSTGR